MSTTRTRHYDDEDDERERRDRSIGGLLRDGQRLRTSMFAMDSVQRSIALTDAYGRSSAEALSRPGPRYASGLVRDGNSPDRDEMREFADAERAAEYRGGLQPGDRISLGGKSFVVDRREADGSTGLALDRRSAEELKEAAYEAYDAANQSAWRGSDSENSVRQEGDSCTTKDGRKGRVVRRNMALVCEPVSDSSDALLPDLIQQHDARTADAYAEYDRDLQNSWRSK